MSFLLLKEGTPAEESKLLHPFHFLVSVVVVLCNNESFYLTSQPRAPLLSYFSPDNSRLNMTDTPVMGLLEQA